MKRYICCIIALLSVIFLFIYILWYILYGSNYTHGVYEINITARCIYNNSVGDEWVKTYTMDGESIWDGEKITAPLDEVKQKTIKITIKERDKHPDESSKILKIALRDNETETTVITVTENNGRFKGNAAKWEITFSVGLVEKTVKGGNPPFYCFFICILRRRHL